MIVVLILLIMFATNYFFTEKDKVEVCLFWITLILFELTILIINYNTKELIK